MAETGIAKSFLSCSSPGTHLVPGNDKLARDLTREVNDYASSLKKQYPSKFGFFASLPLPDVEGTLVEIDYALDILDADGFVVMTNAHGTYMGDKTLRPVLEKLNARKSVVFVHPTSPCNRHSRPATPEERLQLSSPLADSYVTPMFEFLLDTTRTFIDLIISGHAVAYPEIRWIVAHCGAALPSLLDRVCALTQMFPHAVDDRNRTVTKCEVLAVKQLLNRQFWFDLAGFPLEDQIQGLLRWVGNDRLLVGSDFPWTPAAGGVELVRKLTHGLADVVGEEGARNVFDGNAEGLLMKT